MSPPRSTRLGGLAVEVHGPEPGATGAGPAPTIVMVPGAMDRASGFRRTIRHMSDRRVVAIDRRGYAGSIDVGVAPDLGVHADDLAAVCAATGGPVLVVGHSQGALIALAAAARDRIERLVGIVAWEPPMPWFDWYIGSSLALTMGEDPPEAAEHFMRAMIGDRLWERLPEATRTARRAEGPALLADLAASRVADAAPDLTAVSVPTIVGRGSQSRPHHRRSAEIAAAEVPGATLVEIDGAGHGVHLSHPAAFAGLVAQLEARLADPATRR